MACVGQTSSHSPTEGQSGGQLAEHPQRAGSMLGQVAPMMMAWQWQAVAHQPQPVQRSCSISGKASSEGE